MKQLTKKDQLLLTFAESHGMDNSANKSIHNITNAELLFYQETIKILNQLEDEMKEEFLVPFTIMGLLLIICVIAFGFSDLRETFKGFRKIRAFDIKSVEDAFI